MRIHLGLDSSYLAMCLHLTNGDSSVLNPLKRLRGPCFLNFVENDHDRLQLYHRVVGTIGGWQHSKGSILGPSLYLEAEVINRQQHWEKVHLSYWVHGIHDSSEQKLPWHENFMLDIQHSRWGKISSTWNVFLQKWFRRGIWRHVQHHPLEKQQWRPLWWFMPPISQLQNTSIKE